MEHPSVPALCEKFLCNRNSGSVPGWGFLSHSQPGQALLQENSHSWGGRKIPHRCGFVPAVVGRTRPSPSPGVLQPWQPLGAISHTCCPQGHPRALLALPALGHCPVIPVRIWFLCRTGSPQPSPSSLSLQHQKVKHTEVVCD